MSDARDARVTAGNLDARNLGGVITYETDGGQEIFTLAAISRRGDQVVLVDTTGLVHPLDEDKPVRSRKAALETLVYNILNKR